MMCELMLERTQSAILGARFISLNVDEINIIDNQSWISIHVYVGMEKSAYPFHIVTHC